MPSYRVRLFILPQTGPKPAPKPEEHPGFSMDAADNMKAMDAARVRLTAWGYKVRSLSPSVDDTLVAVVFPKE